MTIPHKIPNKDLLRMTFSLALELLWLLLQGAPSMKELGSLRYFNNYF